RLETRTASLEGTGEITMRDLLRNALRMRPDRIILGEIRGAEALDVLQAMNTGHDGSMSTIHANRPREALTRLEQMIGMAGLEMSPRTIRMQIASAIHVVIQLGRLSDGTRRLLSIQELAGMEGEIVTMNEVFKYVRTGIDEEGKVIGSFQATGIRPKFVQQLESRGLKLSADIFDPSRPVD
ncbi:MAG TPA: ATPase, T2SS/T4P/T4SS family, partial [Stellaceae bacterium]|nr:ATPase, T2SS/T4P/T4SS family [Stellaceae bacterium]